MTNDNLPARRAEDGLPPQTWREEPVSEYLPMDVEPEEGSGIDPMRLFAALLRFKWLIVLTTLLGAAGGGFAWTRVDLEYVAGASLWIETSDLGRTGGSGGITAGRLLRSSSWIDLLRSFAVLNTVVVDEKLYLSLSDSTPATAFSSFELEESFVPGDYGVLYSPASQTVTLFRDGASVEERATGEPLGAVVGFDWIPPSDLLPPDSLLEFTVSVPRAVAADIERNLDTRIDRNATFIRVSLRGGDPERVSSTLNAILDQHVRLAAELKSAALQERSTVLEGQLVAVEAELRGAERALEFFRVNTIALPSDAAIPIQGGIAITQGAAFQAYTTLKLEIEALRSGRRAMERVLAELPDSTVRVVALEAIPAVRTSSELVEAMEELGSARIQLRTLRQRYTEEYREVRELARTVQVLETETVPALLRTLVRRVQDDEDRLQDRIDAATVELGEIPPRTIEESRLERQVSLSDRLYGELRGRYQEAVLASASSVPDVRILDRASPPTKPEVDNRLRVALMVLLAGIGAGLGLAIVLDRFDTRVQYTSDITNALGLDILGTVPVMGGGGAGGDRQAVEAFRDLRVNLEFAYGTGKPLALTLTSPDQAEGKSTVTANLAIGFAAVRRRTLVIDGDTRKGDLHRILDVPRKPGLTDFLRGDAALQDTVQSTRFTGLDIIASGSRSESSPELIASGRLGDLLGELWKRYDVILVDSPPLGAGSDALVLGTLTGQLAVVLRTGQTNLGYAKAKLADLERLPVRLLGVILNGFVPGRAQGYYSYSEYLDGYAAVDEPEGSEVLAHLGTVER